MRKLVISRQLQPYVSHDGMIAAHLKVMRALGSDLIVGQILRFGRRADRVESRKWDLLEVGRLKHSAIVRMEHIRCIRLVRDADSRTDLSFVVLILNDVGPDAEIERPTF